MTVKELIKQLLDEDMEADLLIQTSEYQPGIMARYWTQPIDGISMHHQLISDGVVLVTEKHFWEKESLFSSDDEARIEELEYAAKSGDREEFDRDEIKFLTQLLRKALK